MDEKQQDEMRWAERLKEMLSGFPEGEITPWKPDPPDIIVKSPAGIIGIEVSRLMRPTPPGHQLLQARESNCKQIATRAKKLHQDAGLPPVRVDAYLWPQPIVRRDVDPLAKALAGIVHHILPDLGGSTEEEYEYTNRDYFPEQIHLVRVNRAINDDGWHIHEAAWSMPRKSDYLQEALTSKLKRYASAKEHCAEVWLLLVADALGFLGTYVEFADEAFTATYATPFDRVFVIHQFGRKMAELLCKPASS